MERFVKGTVVVIPFPFSDLSASKCRPALVLTDFFGDDVLLCQITSQYHSKDKKVIALKTTDFKSGTLPVDSYIRPTRIFTADKSLIIRTAGVVSDKILNQTVDKIIELLKQ
jgi:mRNA interferase MazF